MSKMNRNRIGVMLGACVLLPIIFLVNAFCWVIQPPSGTLPFLALVCLRISALAVSATICVVLYWAWEDG